VRENQKDYATALIAQDYTRITQLSKHDVSAQCDLDAVVNEEANRAVCPACSAVFNPQDGTCPDCGLKFM
jgi:predicted amidophosphoribosyltransferase